MFCCQKIDGNIPTWQVHSRAIFCASATGGESVTSLLHPNPSSRSFLEICRHICLQVMITADLSKRPPEQEYSWRIRIADRLQMIHFDTFDDFWRFIWLDLSAISCYFNVATETVFCDALQESKLTREDLSSGTPWLWVPPLLLVTSTSLWVCCVLLLTKLRCPSWFVLLPSFHALWPLAQGSYSAFSGYLKIFVNL